MSGYPLLLMGDAYPSLKKSFESSVSRLGLMYDFQFGSSATAGSGQTAITNATDLATWFDAYQQASGQYTNNKEYQRYSDFSATSNFVFNADNLQLTAQLPAGHGGYAASPTAAVNYARTVPLANTSGITVGQVAGFGAEGYDNLHFTRTFLVAGSIVAGNTLSIKPAAYDGSWACPSSLTVTITGSDTVSTVAAALVALINANATLAAQNFKAYIHPDLSSLVVITVPKNPDTVVNDYGKSAKGSLGYYSTNITVTGSITFTYIQALFAPFVVAKDASSVTLSHPVTLSTSSTVTFSPSRIILATAATNNATTLTVAAGRESGIVTGQCIVLNYSDNNLVRVTSTASGVITMYRTVYMQKGAHMLVYPVYEYVTASASTGTVVTVTQTPTGASVGQVAANYYGTTYALGKTKVTAVDTVAKTITLDTAMTFTSGETIILHPEITSGQIWSKFIFAPGMDSRQYIAGEIEADFPNAAVLAAWPAFWCFSAYNDPNPTSGGSGTSESDFTDTFNFFNNTSANNYMPQNSNSMTKVFSHPEWSSGVGLSGNNMGRQTRKVQFILTPNRAYYYLDGRLILVTKFTWNNYKRAQFSANLAVGSASTTNNSNGFYPVDHSQFPMKYKIRRMRFWAAPNATPPM